MPTRTLATMLLQYHQNEILVTSSTSFTGLGRLPLLHIQRKFARNSAETRSASASKPCCPARRTAGGIKRFQCVGHPLRRKKNSCCKPNPAQGEIEATRYLGKGSDFRIINPAEPVCLHHPVPDAPDKCHEHNSL